MKYVRISNTRFPFSRCLVTIILHRSIKYNWAITCNKEKKKWNENESRKAGEWTKLAYRSEFHQIYMICFAQYVKRPSFVFDLIDLTQPELQKTHIVEYFRQVCAKVTVPIYGGLWTCIRQSRPDGIKFGTFGFSKIQLILLNSPFPEFRSQSRFSRWKCQHGSHRTRNRDYQDKFSAGSKIRQASNASINQIKSSELINYRKYLHFT